MQTTLPKDLRRKLESAIVKARDIAESAARTELQRLAVGEKTAASYLSDEQRQLRNRLRAHGRQLGDRRKPDGEQAIDRLITEVAYEHWHRMLFARFLAENDLLIYEDGVTPVSIHDCFELAEEETGDRTVGWQYAARYAGNMLPQIFRVDSPVFSLTLAPNDQKELEQLLTNLDGDVFTASDSLGWVYQFWQSKKKDEVNAAEVKIGADELPAVTQLFTEPYMVSFLLDNSLGSWWAARRLSASDFATATSEEEMRAKAAIPGVPLEYLRFVKADEGGWEPASGAFESWPQELSKLKVLDPCCGSGHFLVNAFNFLVCLRVQEENLSIEEAICAVLAENLFGLELDHRCTQIAAFNLAMSAWKLANKLIELPPLNIACTGLSIGTSKKEWLGFAGDDSRFRAGMDGLFELFKHAPVLGSLVDPDLLSEDLFQAGSRELEHLLNQALMRKSELPDDSEKAVAAFGMARSAELLSQKYTLCITNVPFLGLRKQNEVLKDYCSRYFSDAKEDLATVFLARIFRLVEAGGTIAIVSPQNWFYQHRYRHFRADFLEKRRMLLCGRVGENGFQSSDAAGAFVALSVISATYPKSSELISSIDAAGGKTPIEKVHLLRDTELNSTEQHSQLRNPDARISFETPSHLPPLRQFVESAQGIKTGDDFLWTRYFWEIFPIQGGWQFYQTSNTRTVMYGGRSSIIDWSTEGVGMVRPRLDSVVVGKHGIALSAMREIKTTFYSGNLHYSLATPLVPIDEDKLAAIWCYCSSQNYNRDLRDIDQNIAVTTDTLSKVPFDMDKWKGVAEREFPIGLPEPFTDDCIQWIFHGHPCGSVIWDDSTRRTANGPLRTDDTVLQVAVARLVGFRWPAELDDKMELAEEQRERANQCEQLLSFADDDGIACIPAVRGEQPAFERVEALLQAAYGDQWSISVRDKLLESAGCKNKSLDFWLREKFFEQHYKLFQDRPFIWHIWDGLKDGFAALVNYHQLDRKNLERLIYTYLDDWIRTQKQGQSEGVDGAGIRLAAAQGLKRRLEQILQGEAPYDIFVRWKPLEEQPVGWDPDLNDGVRLNIRPFLSVEDVCKKGAGILRAKPNIKWNKDRGKDVPSAPWYSLGLEYGEGEGARINDHHLTLAEKKAASDG